MSAQTAETPNSPDAARLAAARRLQRGKEICREFSKHRSGVFGLIVLLISIALALFAPLLVPAESLDVTKITAPQNQPPNWAFPLGTDPAGRSVLGMLLWGARSSLVVGLAATAVSMVIGTVMGMCAGHFSGFGQAVLLRIIDFFLVIPGLVLAIVLSVVIGPGILVVVLAIGVTSWAGTARLVRSQTLTVEARPYIERSWALGASHLHVIGKHVLPAVLPLVLANTTLAVGSAVIAESTLSFLGLGDPSTVSWGSMLKSALDTGAATAGFWWFILPPGLAIIVVVLCFTLLGRALESIVNPALRGR